MAGTPRAGRAFSGPFGGVSARRPDDPRQAVLRARQSASRAARGV